jgi:hypothetical protein
MEAEVRTPKHSIELLLAILGNWIPLSPLAGFDPAGMTVILYAVAPHNPLK